MSITRKKGQNNNVRFLWAAWYKDKPLTLSFPDNWNAKVFAMRDAPGVSEAEIKKALIEPIGSAPIRELAKGRRKVALIVDDISRPTKQAQILPLLIRELNRGGIEDDNIFILIALGCHRPMMRQDMIRKMGKKIVERISIYNHDPYENLVDLGKSSMGTPIKVNARLMQADLKIGIGCISPNICGGFGGGAKIILPGVAGVESVEANHRSTFTSNRSASVGSVDPTRLDMEDVARKVGLDAIVNVVVNSKRDTAGIFVGDPVKAHRQGMEFARKVFLTEVPSDVDIGIFNAYPEDTELLQGNKAFYPYISSTNEIVRKGGILVLITASSEGKGFHSLLDEDRRLFAPFGSTKLYSRIIEGKKLVVFSPNLSSNDIKAIYPQGILVKKHDALMEILKDLCDKKYPTVAVFPSGSNQVATV